MAKNYSFESSIGHVRDLPSKKFGIDVENKFTPEYEILSGKEEVVKKLKSAAKNVNTLSDSYSKAAESLMGLAVSSGDSAILGDQIVKVSKNLSALNASYELQLQGSNDHLKATSKFYEGLTELMKNLNDSVDDTKKYKDQIGQLSSNLESLNTIYGNMLTAMRK